LSPEPPERTELLAEVTRALIADLAAGPPAGTESIPEARTALATIECEAAGVLAGIPVAKEVFARVGVRLRALVPDGTPVEGGRPVAELGGSLRAMLTAGPTALAYLTSLSRIASGHQEPVAGSPLDVYAAAFWSPGAPVGDNGPRFQLVVREEEAP
jgi:nicotinate-nucleotide pyrophosphorylase